MNNLKLTFIAIGLYSTAYLVLFLTWALILFNAKSVSDPAQFIAYIHEALIALTAHVLTILNASPPAPPTGAVTAAPASPQAGFVTPNFFGFLLGLVLLGALLLLTGCAGLNVSGVVTATYNTPATTQATLTPGAIAGIPAIGAAVADLMAPMQPVPAQQVAAPAK